MEEEIIDLREKLNKSIENEEKYEVIYKLSIELDELIAKHYKKYLQKTTKYAKIN